jgi:drug/metabolite transporter (DMT)-like permease
MWGPTLLGTLGALVSALLWGLGNVCIETQAGKMPSLALNAFRSAFGSLFFLLALLLPGKQGELLAFDILSLAALALTVLFGYIASDTLFFKSLEYVDVSRAFPIVASYPIFTVFLAWFFLDETLTWHIMVGTPLVIMGAGLLGAQEPSPPGENLALPDRRVKKGITLAVVSSACWGVAATIIKVGVREGDPLAASALMAWGNSLLILAFPIPWARVFSLARHDFRFLGMVAVAGFLGGSGLASLLYVVAVASIGAARAAVLTSTSPLFTAAMAMLLSHELITRRVAVGTVLTVVGVCLVVGGT